MKVQELRLQAKNRGIIGYSRMNKPELLKLLSIKQLDKELPKLDVSDLTIINIDSNKKLYQFGTKEKGTQIIVTHENNIVSDVELQVENNDPEKVFKSGELFGKKKRNIAWMKIEPILMGERTIRKCMGIHIKVIQMGEGKGICTCCVSKMIFAATNCHKKKIKRGFVHVVSKNGRAAFHCYARAFKMNGFEFNQESILLDEDGVSANTFLYFLKE